MIHSVGNVKHIDPDFCIQKYKTVIEKLGNRTGPNVQWIKEYEDDTKMRVPNRNFTDGIPTFNQVASDYTEGLCFVGGRANAGKSTFLINLQKGALENNDNVVIIDLSLDDPPKKRYQQYIAAISGLRYTEVANPAMLDPRKQDILEKARNQFFDWLKSGRLISLHNIEKFSEGKQLNLRDYRTQVHLMRKIREVFPDSKIALFVDAWNNVDITAGRPGSEILQGNEALNYLKGGSEDNEIMGFYSAHIRKTTEKRITIQDIKGTSNIEYDAVLALILRNEQRENQLDEPLVYEMNDNEIPILTIDVSKNKSSDWDYPLFHPANTGACQLFTLNPLEYRQIYDVYRGKRK